MQLRRLALAQIVLPLTFRSEKAVCISVEMLVVDLGNTKVRSEPGAPREPSVYQEQPDAARAECLQIEPAPAPPGRGRYSAADLVKAATAQGGYTTTQVKPMQERHSLKAGQSESPQPSSSANSSLRR